MKNIYQAKGSTLTAQYRDLGCLFGETIRESVVYLSRRWGKQARIRKKVAEKCLENLQAKPVAAEFIACMMAWAEGARITPKQAMWLMADNLSGCQTMMIRYKTGVALLHTEEDYDDMASHMTGERVVALGQSRCIVYNDLMPGAGLYGWKEDLIVAVDTLFLREDEIEQVDNPALANVIAWMVWRMSPSEATAEHVIALSRSLGVLIDGYAINVVRKVGNLTEGYKITLARDESRIENLGSDDGDYLRQVNIVDPQYPRMKWASLPRRIWRGGYKHFLERLATIDRHIKKYGFVAQLGLTPDMIKHSHIQIQKTIYTDLCDAYINSNVGAVCVGLVDKIGTSVSCKLNDEKPFTELEYIDLV